MYFGYLNFFWLLQKERSAESFKNSFIWKSWLVRLMNFKWTQTERWAQLRRGFSSQVEAINLCRRIGLLYFK